MARETPDEIFVRSLLEERYGVVLRRIETVEGVKTPDYELLDGGARVAALEVKTLESAPRTEDNGWQIERRDPHSWRATRDDNAPSRVAAHIRAGAKQLRRYEEPRILAFLNQESLMDVHDLEEAVQGFLPYGTDETGYVLNTASMKIAEGRIREDRWLIDLYVWIEPSKRPRMVLHADGRVEHVEAMDPSVAFRVTSDRGLSVAHRYFGCPADLLRPAWPGASHGPPDGDADPQHES